MLRISVVGLAMGMAAIAGTGTGSPTFNKDVLPILQKNCQGCHRPGEVAPMSLITYKDARPWAKAMKVAVVTQKMPPWFAELRPFRERSHAEPRRHQHAGDLGQQRGAGGRCQGRAAAADVPRRLADQARHDYRNAQAVPREGHRDHQLPEHQGAREFSRGHVGGGGRDARRKSQGGASHEGHRDAAGRNLDGQGGVRRSLRRRLGSDDRREGRHGSAGQVQSWTGRAALRRGRLGEVRAEGLRHRVQYPLHGGGDASRTTCPKWGWCSRRRRRSGATGCRPELRRRSIW